MLRNILNQLLANGLWFATLMIHLSTAATTTFIYLFVAIAIKWFGKNT
jgi:hypothetical protein